VAGQVFLNKKDYLIHGCHFSFLAVTDFQDLTDVYPLEFLNCSKGKYYIFYQDLT
jgi:hypothetical protein